MKFLVVPAEHRCEAENAQRNDDQHGKPHAPVLEEQQYQHRQRAHNVGRHLRQQVGKSRLDGIDTLNDDILVRAGGSVQHRAKGQRRQLVEKPYAGVGKHMERRMVGKRGGRAVEYIA